jgi:hypothetical protein
MVHRIARSTSGRGRPKSGEDDLGSSVRFCRVRELGKLHGPLAKLTEGQAQLGRGWSELAAVAEARPTRYNYNGSRKSRVVVWFYKTHSTN